MAQQSLEKSKIKFLLLEGVHPSAVETLQKSGYNNIEQHKKALSAEELKAAIAGAHFVGIRSRTQLTEEVFEAARKLVAVGCFCIGTNQVDLKAATLRGITVFNAPFSNTRSVAELVLAEAILLLRGVAEKNAAAHRGEWLKTAVNAFEIRGKKLGIIGYGNIGSQLSVVAEALGLKVIFYDIDDKLALGNAKRCSTVEELLAEADVVTLHVDGRPGNAGLFGDDEMRQMKPRSLFLNLSRGIAVDTAALRTHVESGHIAGAAVDVFPIEPKRQGDAFESDLRGLANVILTPHVGGSTEEAQQDIGRFVASKLRSYTEFGSTSLSVNMPELNLPADQGRCRIAHVHRNAPGVLATINSLFGERGVNIEAQSLSTRGENGYVVTDVAEAVSASVLAELGDLPETVRIRQLS